VIDEDARDQNDMVERACRTAFKERFAASGQRIIVVAGLPLGTPGATNFMRIAYVADETAGLVANSAPKSANSNQSPRADRRRLHSVHASPVRLEADRIDKSIRRKFLLHGSGQGLDASRH